MCILKVPYISFPISNFYSTVQGSRTAHGTSLSSSILKVAPSLFVLLFDFISMLFGVLHSNLSYSASRKRGNLVDSCRNGQYLSVSYSISSTLSLLLSWSLENMDRILCHARGCRPYAVPTISRPFCKFSLTAIYYKGPTR